jgi:hypothetical protein
MWDTRKEVVEEELKNILGVQELDPRRPEYFHQRNAAAKRAISNLNEKERAELQQDVDNRRSQGNPDHIKRAYVSFTFNPELFCSLRFSRAEKYREREIRAWSKERWLDMGLATVIFTVHTDQQGRLVADV